MAALRFYIAKSALFERLCFTAVMSRHTGAGAALACLVDSNISLIDLDLSDNHLGGQQARHTFREASLSQLSSQSSVFRKLFCRRTCASCPPGVAGRVGRAAGKISKHSTAI